MSMSRRQTDAIAHTCVNKFRGEKKESDCVIVATLGRERSCTRLAQNYGDDMSRCYTSRSGDTCVHTTPINNESRLLSCLFSAAFPSFSRFYPDSRSLRSEIGWLYLGHFGTRLYEKLAVVEHPHLLGDKLTTL